MKNKKEHLIETSTRPALYADLKQFDPGFSKVGDFIEVTEWTNGEGVDVEVFASQKERFQLTYGQFHAVKTLIKQLEKGL